MESTGRIAIIGAGVSGLATAVTLVRSGVPGHDITLFEARREAGGRTRSYIDPKTGDELDNGQHLLMGCYRATLDYVRMLGTESQIEWQHSLSIPFSDTAGRTSRLQLPQFVPAPFNLLAGLWWSNLLSFRDKQAATRLGLRIRTNNLPPDLDGLTCEALFRQTHQPSSLVRKLWEPLVLATLNLSVARASATLFINVLREAFFADRSASALLFPRTGLSSLLVEPAMRILTDAGVTVRLGEPVRSIDLRSRVTGIRSDDGEGSYEHVVLATPSYELLPGAPTIQTSPIVNAYFWVDAEILDSPIHAFLGSTLQWAFRKESTFAAQRIALTVSAADDVVQVSNQEITDILWKDLTLALPQSKHARLLHAQIIREKRATPALDPGGNSRRPGTKVKNGFFLAGDYVQNGIPATIEGAIRNGFNAAELLLEETG